MNPRRIPPRIRLILTPRNVSNDAARTNERRVLRVNLGKEAPGPRLTTLDSTGPSTCRIVSFTTVIHRRGADHEPDRARYPLCQQHGRTLRRRKFRTALERSHGIRSRGRRTHTGRVEW